MKLVLQKPLDIIKDKLTNPFGLDSLCYNPKTKVFHLKPDLSYGGCKHWGKDFVSFYSEYVKALGHPGTDFACKDGANVYASLEGIVTEIETEPERGLGIGIVSSQKYEFEGGEYQAKIRYWHLKGFNVIMGQEVKAGDLIGYADNTGWSSATHLHWELKAVLNGVNVFQNNGFYGACNAMPMLTDNPQVNIDLIPPLTHDLFYGKNDNEVVYLKRRLGLNLFTNYYGEQTRQAVLRFQKENGICKICIFKGKKVGLSTRQKLNSL